MVQIDITRISSKGQIVIPLEMRKDFKEGDKLLIIKNQNQIIIKKADDSDENFKEDLEFARRTEEAYREIENGGGIEMPIDEFIEQLKKC